MKTEIDFSNIRTVRVHKQQFDAIEKKADVIILECKEDGRSILFDRVRDTDL